MKINIDKKIDEHKCPTFCLCIVATTCYDSLKREHICYRCWLSFCKENNIEIIYD